jgi:putative sigma-54 modulation protein
VVKIQINILTGGTMALDIEITTRNMELTERIQEYVNKKITKLDRFLNGIDETRIELAYVKSARNASDRHVAQITLRGRGFILRSEERSDDIFAAIDASLDKIQRQIERYKGKRQRTREPLSEVMAETTPVEKEEGHPDIARRKEFVLVPMDEQEALEQMALLGHENFFIFFNANKNNINVIYRRRDGSYGLIEPKLG